MCLELDMRSLDGADCELLNQINGHFFLKYLFNHRILFFKVFLLSLMSFNGE